ncbi:MAG: response regulator, partial [Hyphomicrobiaceae bacterium]
MSDIIRIAVVDDHPLMRDGIIHFLTSDPAFELVGEGSTKDDAVTLAEEKQPDILLLDISMPGGGITAARRIAASHPSIKLVMLTVSENEKHVEAALEAGARGYILKGVGGDELQRALMQVRDGNLYVSPELAGLLLSGSEKDPVSSLSAREAQIFSLIPDGLSNREIGERLDLSEKTVKYYMTGIFQKL